MILTLELATRGFVSSHEEEEYELTKILNREQDSELDDENEENVRGDISRHPEADREIFDDEDTELDREYF